MNRDKSMEIFVRLEEALQREIVKGSLQDERISIRFKALSSEEAIGDPEDRDYPIIKGRERIVEADFKGAKGQAFTDEFSNADYSIAEILAMSPDSNRKRAHFIAAINAIYKYLGLCDKTVHCRDAEPRECAQDMLQEFKAGKKVLLVGLQPRFLEFLVKDHSVRVVDLDEENIGSEKFGVVIEDSERTDDAIKWCDTVLATGSTIVNGTIDRFINAGKPCIFYGVTISAAAKILGLKTYCSKGH